MLTEITEMAIKVAQILIPVCIGVVINEWLTRRKYQKIVEEEMKKREHLGSYRSPPEWEDWDT